MRTVGLLHPGEMGASVGAALRRARVQVLWVSAGRGAATRRRAQAADLTDAGTLPELVARSQLVMSVGPPHAATDVARTVAALGFGGIYVDANAVAPTDLEAVVLAGDVAAASALKMCYAAWTKGTSALLLAIRAAAAAHGVEAALAAEWERTQPGLAARSQAAAGTARKAWRVRRRDGPDRGVPCRDRAA
jgi:hypothetical protein